MLDSNFSFINEAFNTNHVTPFEMDYLLAEGWRNFGTYFFRHNIGIYRGELRRVIPLRIRLQNFTFSKSQRRNLQRNQDLQMIVRPISIDVEKEQLFQRHKRRFAENVPDSLYVFLSRRKQNAGWEF